VTLTVSGLISLALLNVNVHLSHWLRWPKRQLRAVAA
jgi:hypothetical protein